MSLGLGDHENGINCMLVCTYALKSCLLINTTLMPVTHAMRFRNRMPYANANIDEFKTSDGNFKSVVLSSHRPQIKFGFVLRNCKIILRYDEEEIEQKNEWDYNFVIFYKLLHICANFILIFFYALICASNLKLCVPDK